MSITSGWGRGTWGQGAWNEAISASVDVSVTGVSATGSIGSVTIIEGLLAQLLQQARRFQALLVLRVRELSGHLQLQLQQMFRRQGWQPLERLEQFRSLATRARLLQVWRELDLSERLLLPAARLLLLVVMQALERLALLRSRAQRVSKLLGSKLKVALEAFQLQDKQAFLLRVLRGRER